jgi:UDP-GlcNAc:undecaprenyl-phosphate/decaprenyl-phosphate GlcNAc-1-phosphate transferase
VPRSAAWLSSGTRRLRGDQRYQLSFSVLLAALVPNLFAVGAPILAFVITFGLIKWMLSSGRVRLALDHPNARSLHTSPIPRTGGLAIISAALLAGGLVAPQPASLLACAAGLALVSFLDDSRGLAVTWRLTAHLAIATVFVWMNISGSPLYLLGLFVLALVWMTNLYNFMDGSDGLAGGMTVIGFGSYAVAGWLSGDSALAWLTASIAASALAFLYFNFHPARIFLGDAGSIPLGFLAAAIGLLGWKWRGWPAWFPFLVFSPFIVDASVTLVRRFLRGEKVWQAHRSHYYQRLVQIGWGHRKTALAEYVLMLAAGVCAVWGIGRALTEQIILLGVWVVIYVGLAVLTDRSCRNQERQAVISES